MKTAGCTVTTSDLLPEAIVLSQSFMQHHPDAEFFIVCLDRPWALSAFAPLAPDRVGIIAASSLPDIPPLRRLLFEWAHPGPLRAAWASCIAAVFRQSPETELLMAFAPWTLVHDSLGAQSLLDSDASWALTKRMTRAFSAPESRSGTPLDAQAQPRSALFRSADAEMHDLSLRARTIHEVDVLLGSTLSPDFAVFHRSALPNVLVWLETRLLAMASRSETWRVGLHHPELLERVIDVAASLFAPRIVSDAGIDVAPWNIGERHLERLSDGSVGALGSRLKTTNHSGYSHDRPWTFRPDQSMKSPWDLNDSRVAGEIWQNYGEAVARIRSSAAFPRLAEGAVIAPNTIFSPSGRYALRAQQVRDSLSDHHDEPLNAFEDEFAAGISRIAWLRSDTILHGTSLGPDERRVIQRLGDDKRFIATRPPAVPGSNHVAGIAERGRSPHGVDVLGHLRSVSGLGEAVRRLLGILQRAGVPTTAHDLPMSSNPSRLKIDVDDALHHAILLSVINGDYTADARQLVGPASYDKRYVIGQWAWETEVLPLEHRRGFAYVDEVWANSTFVRDIISTVAPEHIPVLYVPAPVEMPEIDPSLDRSFFGLDSRTMLLFMFDYLSTIGRKNPVGAIEAFREAFDPSDGVQLVVKSINGSRSPEPSEEVRWAASGRKDIILADGFLSRKEANTLLKLSDIYVSLHRSEGLGFTMAEAMLLGRPVIASAYGGNLDFMDDQNAVLVPTTRGTADRDYPPYMVGSAWAEPDLSFAATAMRDLVRNPEKRARIGLTAAQSAAAHFDAKRCGQAVVSRLNEIRQGNGGSR